MHVGDTAQHLHQRIAEHKYSAIGKHLLEVHGNKILLKKCVDCLVYEMLFIKDDLFPPDFLPSEEVGGWRLQELEMLLLIFYLFIYLFIYLLLLIGLKTIN